MTETLVGVVIGAALAFFAFLLQDKIRRQRDESERKRRREEELRGVLGLVLRELEEAAGRPPFVDLNRTSGLWLPFPDSGFAILSEMQLLSAVPKELLGPLLAASLRIRDLNFLIDCQVRDVGHALPARQAKGFMEKIRDESKQAIDECIRSITKFLDKAG